MPVSESESRTLSRSIDSLYLLDILRTRPSRARGTLTELCAYERLHEALLRTPNELLQVLVETANELFGVETSGISLLETGPDTGDVLRWCAIAGRYAYALDTTMPRHVSPCAHVLDRDEPLLLRHPEIDFPVCDPLQPPVEEALLAPFHVNDVPVGTIWLVLHRPGEMFDHEDGQLLIRLSRFAAVGYQLLRDAERVQLADRQKDRFLATLAHELRNPLGSIGNATELLERLTGEMPETQRPLAILRRQTRQLTRLVDDLLDISRIAAGRITLEEAPVSLETIVDQAVEAVQPLMREKGQRLSMALHKAHLHVRGDRARLVQALSNVLHNAAKYTDSHGEITLSVYDTRSHVTIEVRDNGVGISAELLPHVFDLFVQCERTLDRSQGGLGIGLSVVKRLVEMQGGTVSVASPGVGRGSTFTIQLPRIESPHLVVAPASRRSAARARRILVVDDNIDAADSLVMLLGMDGHEVHAVYDAVAALEAVRELEFSAIILDIGLPVINGYEVARRLRAQGYNSLLIALTGYGRPEDLERAQEAGFNSHLVKPVVLESLHALLSV